MLKKYTDLHVTIFGTLCSSILENHRHKKVANFHLLLQCDQNQNQNVAWLMKAPPPKKKIRIVIKLKAREKAYLKRLRL